jgi:soluble lytic murein transglycosylase
MAFLHDRAGLYSTSHWVTRWHVRDFERRWPIGANRARWRIAYPKAFWPLLEEQAKKHGYPTALQIAIVREESAFDPLRESYANAIGLTQMIYPTAIRFAKGTGIDVSRDTMRDPEKNAIVGGNFLGFLWDKWEGLVALVPPSYNAGEGATSRWLRERGDLPTDEWSETIPGDQARRYSKRVLASFFVYSFLEDGTIPAMPNAIPKDLIPEKKKRAHKKGKKRGKARKHKKAQKRNY